MAFSTANEVPRVSGDPRRDPARSRDRAAVRAAIEATEEAILNALCMADDMTGRAGTSRRRCRSTASRRSCRSTGRSRRKALFLVLTLVLVVPRSARAQTCWECGSGDNPCASSNAPTWCSCVDDPAGCDSGNAGYNGGTGGGAVNSSGGSGGPAGGTVPVYSPGANPANRIPGPNTDFVKQYAPAGTCVGTVTSSATSI